MAVKKAAKKSTALVAPVRVDAAPTRARITESSTDALLRDINDKIRNRNIFAWKIMFGWLMAAAICFIGFPISMLADSKALFAIFWLGAAVVFAANLAIGITALYKSTKDCPK
ncbi:MAG: hypothetical protein LBL46_04345 [Rickettsiales bacterium]|jgi:hypothetical protein|nr:hypothetical protein [Rickettsiales bacterium]